MRKFQISAPSSVIDELEEHLYMNGYHFSFNDDILEVDDDEASYVLSILRDRGIGFVEID